MTQIQNLLSELGLFGALEQYKVLCADMKNDKAFDSTMLESILTSEINYQSQKRQSALLKVSRLPMQVSVTGVKYDEVRGKDFKDKFSFLTSMEFVETGRNLTIFGNPGSGKTYIAAVLGKLNCLKGRGTLYFSTKDLLITLMGTYGSHNYTRKLRALSAKSLIILDDFALTPLESREQEILFDFLNMRYEKHSTIIVSQKTPDLWADVLGRSALAESIIERAATNNYVLTLKGNSRRKPVEAE